MKTDEMRREKARQLRYQKPICKSLNLWSIREDLDDISESCDEVRYFTDYDDDTLLNALDGDEDDAQQFRLSFADLSAECEKMREDLEEVKSDFSAFRLRYEDIYSKEILEIFNLEELWQETFRSDLEDEERIVIATNKFRPDNIIVGQNYIAAQSKSKAVEWLNIVRTALIFVDDNSDDLKKELNDTEEEKIPEVRDSYDDVPNTFENFWD